MTLPAAATAVCETFLAELPDGLLTGLYLRGGLGFDELGVWTSPEHLLAFTRGNLDGYWREGGDDEYPRDPAARGRDTAAFTAYVVERGTS